MAVRTRQCAESDLEADSKTRIIWMPRLACEWRFAGRSGHFLFARKIRPIDRPGRMCRIRARASVLGRAGMLARMPARWYARDGRGRIASKAKARGKAAYNALRWRSRALWVSSCPYGAFPPVACVYGRFAGFRACSYRVPACQHACACRHTRAEGNPGSSRPGNPGSFFLAGAAL